MLKTTIFIANDHRGVDLKNSICTIFSTHYDIINLGINTIEPVDYPIYSKILTESMLSNPNSYGILICGSGIGMSISANRVSNIRAALCVLPQMAILARAHNDANVLVMSADLVDLNTNIQITSLFLETKFEGDRHKKRIDMY